MSLERVRVGKKVHYADVPLNVPKPALKTLCGIRIDMDKRIRLPFENDARKITCQRCSVRSLDIFAEGFMNR